MNGDPVLTHAEQQDAAERIHKLMAEGISSGEAIKIIANEIRSGNKEKKDKD